MSNPSAPALAASLFALTAAVAYARTGSPQQTLESLPTNTALVIALFALVGGAISSVRTRSPASILLGHVFGALYILSFARLRAGLSSGAEIALLASVLLAVVPILKGWNALPKESGYIGVYGVAVFAHAYGGVWLAAVLLFSLVLLVFRDDLRQLRDRVDQAL